MGNMYWYRWRPSWAAWFWRSYGNGLAELLGDRHAGMSAREQLMFECHDLLGFYHRDIILGRCSFWWNMGEYHFFLILI